MPKPKAESTLAIVEKFSIEMFQIAQLFNSPGAPPDAFSTQNIMDATENLFVAFSLKDGPADPRLYLCCGSDSDRLAQFCRAHEDTMNMNVYNVTMPKKSSSSSSRRAAVAPTFAAAADAAASSVVELTDFEIKNYSSQQPSHGSLSRSFLVARVQLADNTVPSCNLCEATINHILQLGGAIGKYILAVFLNFNKVRAQLSGSGHITLNNLQAATQDCSYHYLHKSFSLPGQSTVMYVSCRVRRGSFIDVGMCAVPSAGGNILFAEKKKCTPQNILQLVSQQIEASNVTHCCLNACGRGGMQDDDSLAVNLVAQLAGLHYMTTFSVCSNAVQIFWFDKRCNKDIATSSSSGCGGVGSGKAVASKKLEERRLLAMLSAVIAPHASRSSEECVRTCRALGYNIDLYPLSISSFLHLFKDAAHIRLPSDTTFADAISRAPVTPYDPGETLNMFSGNNRKITGTKNILGKLVACETNLGRSYYREMINAPFTDSERLARHYDLVRYASQELSAELKQRIRAWDLEHLQTATLKGEFTLFDFVEILELLEKMYVIGGSGSCIRRVEDASHTASAAACAAFAPISAASDGSYCLPPYGDIESLYHYITEQLSSPISLKRLASRELLVFLTGGASGISEKDMRRLHTILATDITRGGAYIRVESLSDLARLHHLLEPLSDEDDGITETLLSCACLTTHTKPEPKDFVAGAVEEYTAAARKLLASFLKSGFPSDEVRQIDETLLHCIPSPHKTQAREGSLETVESYCFNIAELRGALFCLLEMMLMLSPRRRRSKVPSLLCSDAHDMELPGLLYVPPYMPKSCMAAGPLVSGRKMEKNFVYPINEVREHVLMCNGLHPPCQARAIASFGGGGDVDKNAYDRCWTDKPSAMPIKNLQTEWASVHTPQVKKKFSFVVDAGAATDESDKFAIVYDRLMVDLLQPLLAIYREAVASNVRNAVSAQLMSAKQGYYMHVLLNVIRSTANIDKMISISKLFSATPPPVADGTTAMAPLLDQQQQCWYARRSRINVIVPTILSNSERPSGFSARGISNDLTYEGRRVYMASSKYNVDVWDSSKDSIILYGQNGVGKTTLLDAIFLNVLMAQAGIGAMAEQFHIVPYKNLVIHYTNTIDRHVIHAQSPFMNDVDVINFTRSCDAGKTLAICDEILTTTNPDQAVDLLAATLNCYTACGIQYVCATHFRELQVASLPARIMNIRRSEEDGRRVLGPGSGDVFDVFTIVEKAGMPVAIANEARERNRKRKRGDGVCESSTSSSSSSGGSGGGGGVGVLTKVEQEKLMPIISKDLDPMNDQPPVGPSAARGMSRLDAFRFRRAQTRSAAAAAAAAAAVAVAADKKEIDLDKWTKCLPASIAGKPCLYNSHKVYTGVCENYKKKGSSGNPQCASERLYDAGYWCVATQIDHVIPQYIFRSDPSMNDFIQMNSEANLQELCPDCHAKKTSEEATMRARCRDIKDVVDMYKQISLKKINDLFEG